MINEENRKILEDACAARGWGCALSRLARSISDCEISLTNAAVSIGLSVHEANGVMDGWDTATGRGMWNNVGCFAPMYRHIPPFAEPVGVTEDALAQYDAGVELGRELAWRHR